MVVTLIGYRGSGKSSVGPRLAARWGFRSVDADDVIETRAGCTIREIFERQGEPAFRKLEREVLVELLGENDLVIAAGGGAILNEETREDMRAAGPVVWLQASVDDLAARIGADSTTNSRRPNLTTSGGRGEIAQMLSIREPLYRQTASLVVETAGWSLDDIADSIGTELDPIVHGGDAG